ncbi:DUF3274 domain-containing protein, partial [Duganella sp. Leaf61]|uniref:effector protein Tle3 domain-containing protein n=1 Tax=Duganella sp. Leaf61 TaxID=1736227 RepID=UPI001E50F134
TALSRPRVNAVPEADWEVPVNAPALHPPFLPESMRFGQASAAFDQGYDPPGASRSVSRVRESGDGYAGVNKAPDGTTDTALGNNQDEASLRYEHHAMLRLRAKREKRYAADAKVVEEDDPSKASAEYTAWRTEHIKVSLAETVDAAATDHSTIFTNPMHSERALAFDVSIGVSNITSDHLRKLSTLADWRYLDKLNFSHSKKMSEYFERSTIDDTTLKEWIQRPDNEVTIPENIKDSRA